MSWVFKSHIGFSLLEKYKPPKIGRELGGGTRSRAPPLS